jgi:uncharacterized protein (DUF952 family)
MTLILHMTTQNDWDRSRGEGQYTIDSLDTEGFIHCSLPDQVHRVANALYTGRTDLILLHVDQDLVGPNVRYEGDPEAFPHIYGPLNLDAVIRVTDYRPGPDGVFEPPESCDTGHNREK